MEKLTRTMTLVDDAGRKHKISVYTTYMETTSFEDDGSEPLALTSRLVTADGRHVNSKGNGVYEIVETGTRLREIKG
jgi:hypothetical protein